jgi:hypothetical protein
MHRRVAIERVPERRIVVEFNYRGQPTTYIWLVFEHRDCSVCIQHPGFETDVLVDTDAVSLMRVFSGIVSLGDAVDRGTVRLHGLPALTRAFGQWFSWSPFAPEVAKVVAARRE